MLHVLVAKRQELKQTPVLYLGHVEVHRVKCDEFQREMEIQKL
uniref:Uncharacterized protein n=1 Tax=Tetranychus urticae TaxID=32264 RepID=T1JWE8_TETUR